MMEKKFKLNAAMIDENRARVLTCDRTFLWTVCGQFLYSLQYPGSNR